MSCEVWCRRGGGPEGRAVPSAMLDVRPRGRTVLAALACCAAPVLLQAQPAPSSAPARLGAGNFHGCALAADDTARCWGSDAAGQHAVPDGHFVRVSAGGTHTCALRADGRAVCWGGNEFGQSSPPPGRFIDVTAGGYHSCGLRPELTIACWGGTGARMAIPDGPFTQVSAGFLHTCALKPSGAIVCWGDDSQGQSSPPR